MPAGDVAKAFNRLHAVNKEVEAEEELDSQRRQQREQEAEELLASNVAPTSTDLCVPWILKAWDEGNYFKCAPASATMVPSIARRPCASTRKQTLEYNVLSLVRMPRFACICALCANMQMHSCQVLLL